MLYTAISSEPIDLSAAFKAFEIKPESGALSSFIGIVRNHDHGRQVYALDYEAHETMAPKILSRIAQKAHEEYRLNGLLIIHREGSLKVGDLAVVILCQSDHRLAAITATHRIIETIKARLPVWKKEFYSDGGNAWVQCHHQDKGEQLVID